LVLSFVNWYSITGRTQYENQASRILVGQIRDCELAKKVGTVFGFSHVDGFFMKNKTILVVEDNDLNMKLFHDLLEAHGYETLQTKDGLEALEMARDHRPDLILMDIQLPKISGLEVTKWLKADDELKMIPVIAVTAFAMKGDEEKIRQGGCEAYVAKPISITHFLDTVQQYVN